MVVARTPVWRSLSHGQSQPQKGVLKEQEIKDVLAYVRKTFGE